jgi:inositol oxygenase
VYQEGCGLRNVYMSWGAAEYLYMLLVLNQTALPEEALFMIRWVVQGRQGAQQDRAC